MNESISHIVYIFYGVGCGTLIHKKLCENYIKKNYQSGTTRINSMN